MTNSKAYDDRLLALVDVLGWKALINESVRNPTVLAPIQTAIGIIVAGGTSTARASWSAAQFGSKYAPDAQFSHFSDTFVLSVPANPAGIPYITMMVADVCRSLLEAGLYTRGAVVRGKLVHTTKALYGPAVIEAYDLERTVAKYPRILVTPEAAASIETLPCVRQDSDGLTFLDVLRHYVLNDGGSRLHAIRLQAEANLERHKADLGLVAKHIWLLNYLRSAEHDMQAPVG